MACLGIGEFQAYVAGKEDSTLRAKVDGHVAGCGRCGAALERVRVTNIRVDGWLCELAEAGMEGEVNVMGALARVVMDDGTPRFLTPDFRGGWFGKPRYLSLALHTGFVALLMFGATSPVVQESVREKFNLIDPNLKPYLTQGGGGGGAKDRQPVTEGRLPKPEPKQFVPPQIVERTAQLILEPTIIAPPDVPLPQSALSSLGDPLAKVLNASNGRGFGGAMGDGHGGGVGVGTGPGAGPGDGGGIGGAVFYPGGGVSQPVLLVRVSPDYSDEARKARYSGSVLLTIVVDVSGRTRDIRVVRSPGMGLDEKAVEAVRNWRFKPGMKDGQPVNVRAQVEVFFRLL
jgi:periplasmic protein TonB